MKERRPIEGHENGADWRKLCSDGEQWRCIIYSLTSSFNIYGHESGEGMDKLAQDSAAQFVSKRQR